MHTVEGMSNESGVFWGGPLLSVLRKNNLEYKIRRNKMLKYATVHGILTPPSISRNYSGQGVEFLGYFKVSCSFMQKSLAGYADRPQAE